MNDELSLPDRNGRKVVVGSRVRVAQLGRADFRHLSDGAFADLARRFVGNVFVVEEIDAHGQAWVSHTASMSKGRFDGDTVGLSSGEIELV